MGHFHTFDTAQNLVDSLTEQLAFMDRRDPLADMVSSVDIQRHNVLATADSFDYEFDLKRYWLSRHRWIALTRQYIDSTDLEVFLDKTAMLKHKVRGISVFRTKTVPMRVNKITSRRWGSCILTISYRATPKPLITLHSRASYLGYLAMFDVNVAHVIARLVGERVGVVPEEMGFEWFTETMQYHDFRCIAYVMGSESMRERVLTLAGDEPTSSQSQFRTEHFGAAGNFKWWEKFEEMDDAGIPYDEMKFNQACRMRRRIHSEVMGNEYGEQFASSVRGCNTFAPLPHILSTSLDFSSIY